MGRPEETAGNTVANETTAERLWTVRECAKYLSMSEKWVYRQVELGTIPFSRLGGRTVRFHPQRVREYAAKLTGDGAKVIPLHGKR